jgi:hypothetical protein
MKYRNLAPLIALVIAPPLYASDDAALIDALVQKGVISQKEADQIRDKSSQELNTTSADQVIHFGDSIKRLTFYGDVRLRAELRNGTYGPGEINRSNGTAYGAPVTPGTEGTGGGSEDRDRFRYRVRMGINADLYDNFFAGVAVSTSVTNNKSNNVTFGTSDSAGPFGKAQGGLAVNKVFIGWKSDYFMVEAGQFDNPLYTTNLTWGPNITPNGVAEQYQQEFGNLGVFATAGQFLYATSSFANSNTTGGNYGTVFRLDEEIGLTYKFDKDIEFKGGIDLATYTGTRTNTTTADTAGNGGGTANTVGTVAAGGQTNVNGATATGPLVETITNNGANQPVDFAGPYTGSASEPYTNTAGINNLFLLDVPVELKWKAWGIPMRAFADWSINLDAQGRSNAAAVAVANGSAVSGAYTAPVYTKGVLTTAASSAYQVLNAPETQALKRNNADQDMAYKVGLEIGQLKDKGDWMGQAYWLDRQYYSLDTNLIDSEIFDGRLNMQGFVLQANYQITKGLTATATFAQATRSDKQLATPGNEQDLNLGSVDNYRLIQTDLQWTF